MKLNKITFRDGTLLESVDATTYLGTEIAKRVDPGLEITRISCSMPVLKKLDLFLKQANVPKKWKLQVFQNREMRLTLKELAQNRISPFDKNGAAVPTGLTQRPMASKTKVVLRGSWGCHRCKIDRGPPYWRMSLCHVPNVVSVSLSIELLRIPNYICFTCTSFVYSRTHLFGLIAKPAFCRMVVCSPSQ